MEAAVRNGSHTGLAHQNSPFPVKRFLLRCQGLERAAVSPAQNMPFLQNHPNRHLFKSEIRNQKSEIRNLKSEI